MGTNHNASLVALGGTGSSDRVVTTELGDPATFKAGLAVRLSAAGLLQLADDSTAVRIGVSLGQDLSDAKKTSVCRAGNWVPIVLKNEGVASSLVVDDLTFTAAEAGTAGDEITIALVDTGALTPAVIVTDNDIVINIDAGVSTATAIKTAFDLSAAAIALASVAIAVGQGAVAQSAAAEAPLEDGADAYGFVVEGAAVKTDDATGEASSDGDTSSAIYVSGPLTGVYPDGTSVGAAYVDMGGGL